MNYLIQLLLEPQSPPGGRHLLYHHPFGYFLWQNSLEQSKQLIDTGFERFQEFFFRENCSTLCVWLSIGMPIPRQFLFLGDSRNRGIAICHSSGIGETKTYSPGFGFGEFRGVFCARFEISFYGKDFFFSEFFFEIKRIL